MKMGEVKSDPNINAINLQPEIAKTTELIQKLLKSEQSIDQRRSFLLEKRNTILEEIKQKIQDRQLQWMIDSLRIQIISLEQFPHQPPYLGCIHRTNKTTTNSSTKEYSEEMRNLNFQFHHSIKNLAAEREISRKLRQCERTPLGEADNTEDAEMLTNPYSIPLRNRQRVRGLKQLPTQDIKRLIKIWAEKIGDASNRLLRDSKSSNGTWQTYDVYQPVDFGKQFYWQVEVGRIEFKRHWDSMPDVKRTIAEIEFGLNKERKRQERGNAKLERLRGKLDEMYNCEYEMLDELRKLRLEKSAASKYLLELTTIETN